MEKINIAELLRDCPTGLELDCAMYENVYFDYVDELNIIHCYVQNEGFKTSITFNQHGTPNSHAKSKCVIFPKGKTTWEGFHRPFKDGDIVTWEDRGSLVAFIYKERKDVAVVKHHFALYTGSLGIVTTGEISLVEGEIVFATEEEKQKLFDAIKANGYHWNAETKTLEELPKFKINNIIRHKERKSNTRIVDIKDGNYIFENGDIMPIYLQNDYEFTTDKFDINTLKPFKSKVLVRNSYDGFWQPTFWGTYEAEKAKAHLHRHYLTTKGFFGHCIPYNDDTKHLLGTTNDCDDFYKTWE